MPEQKKNDAPIVLGVDLDEVVFQYLNGLRDWVRANEHRDLPAGMPETWDLTSSGWFDSFQEYQNTHGAAVDDNLYSNLKMVRGAHAALWELSNSGYEIHIITSRFVLPGQHKKVVSQTVESLDKCHIPYSSISFLHNKVHHYADAYIDDGPHNLENLTNAGRYAIAFNMRYNRDIDAAARAYNWAEVRSILRYKFGR